MNILKLELKRALKNKWMCISILIGVVICLIPVPKKIIDMSLYCQNNILEDTGKIFCADNVFQHFILYDRFEPVLYVFLFVMPILSSLPYGSSFYDDLKTGYVKQIVSRCDIKTFVLSRYISVFISGGVSVTIPVLINFMILSVVYPINKPMRFYSVITGEKTFTIDLFFEHPILQALLWCFILFCVAGALATLSLSVSKYVYNYFGIILTPFVFSFILIFLTYITGVTELSFLYTISTCCAYDMNYWILFMEIIVVLIFSFFVFCIPKREVF